MARVCRRTGKEQFTRRQARAVLVGVVMARNRGNVTRRERRIYKCPLCGWWHLTSSPDRQKGTA